MSNEHTINFKYSFNKNNYVQHLNDSIQLYFSWVTDVEEENEDYIKYCNCCMYDNIIRYSIRLNKENNIISFEELEEILQNNYYYDALELFEILQNNYYYATLELFEITRKRIRDEEHKRDIEKNEKV